MLNAALILTPAGCPTVQYNSHAIHLELASDPTRVTPLQTPLASCKSQATGTSGYRLGVPKTPMFRFDNLLEWLTKIKKVLHFQL